MLRSTFCHLSGVGPTLEAKLWQQGIRSWGDIARAELTPRRRQAMERELGRSSERLGQRDARFFADALPSREQWRLFPEFSDHVAYFDIETTGLAPPDDYVTTIALYDGLDVRHYVCGDNLDDFARDVRDYDLLVSFNGKSFDAPFIRKSMGLDLPQAHIDLMHVLRSLGYRGGLKAVERKFGLGRPDMEDVDGFMAVLLWQMYQQTRDDRVLETLLAYNVQDVLTLEWLMARAFNEKLEATPFADEHHLPGPALGDNPFRAHREVVEAVRRVPFPSW
jgi:uncharacterized protein YprB with RNaseH-like and TPR domain